MIYSVTEYKKTNSTILPRGVSDYINFQLSANHFSCETGSINLGGTDYSRDPSNHIQKHYSNGKSDVYMGHESSDALV